jgi:hypothetical protein
MQKLLRELEKRDVRIDSLRALEVFGGTGKRHTVDYARRVAHLEAWEIQQSQEKILRKKFPSAAVRIVDAYHQVCESTDRFDLIIIDNPMSLYDGHCEHFDLFPDIFGLANSSATIVVNVIPRLTRSAAKRFPYLFNKEQLEGRRRFYDTEKPDDLSWECIVAAYRSQLLTTPFQMEWSFFVKRHFLYYLGFEIREENWGRV